MYSNCTYILISVYIDIGPAEADQAARALFGGLVGLFSLLD